MENAKGIIDEVSILMKQASLFLKEPIKKQTSLNNPSTDIDKKISKFLTKSLKKIINTDVLSEENVLGYSGKTETFWLIDPIDGTMNFISGSPDVAISVALVDKSFNAYIALAYFPYYNELYTAIQNKGAYLNGKKINHSKPKLKIISYGLSEDASKQKDKIVRILGKLIENNFILRQSGSATVDICRVAKGTWLAFFEEGLYVWDVAAASLIAKESGCVPLISSISENNYKCNYLCSNTQSINIELLNIIKDKQ